MSDAATTTDAHDYSSTGIPTGRVAIWWFLASEIAIFGGAVVCYVLMRLRHPEWAEQAKHTMTTAGAINTVVLLTSSLTAVLAHSAAMRKEGERAAMFLWLTVLGAFLFLCVKSFEYGHEISHGLLPHESLFWSFYYLMTGLHALHVTGGALALAIIARSAKRNVKLNRVELGALYWHFVDVVWIFLFPLLYLAS